MAEPKSNEWPNYSSLPLATVEAKLLDSLLFWTQQMWLTTTVGQTAQLSEDGKILLNENGYPLLNE